MGDEPLHRFYNEKKQSIVSILDGGRYIIGGGVFIQVGDEQLILTAAHVIHGKPSPMHIVCGDGSSYKVKTVTISRNMDLGLLKVINGRGKVFQCLNYTEMELERGLDVHLISHPGRLPFAHNIGKISSVSRTCANIYFDDMELDQQPEFNVVPDSSFVDDFLGLDQSLRLIQVKNVHGGGRVGATGAPLLDNHGGIVGIYSFNYNCSDFAVHFSDIQRFLST